jgi:hypothetical protein
MSLCEQFRVDLTQAMKSSDKVRLATLRLLTAAIKNRQIDKGGVLDDAEALDVVRLATKQRREAIALARQYGREDIARQEEQEITEQVGGMINLAFAQIKRESFRALPFSFEIAWLFKAEGNRGDIQQRNNDDPEKCTRKGRTLAGSYDGALNFFTSCMVLMICAGAPSAQSEVPRSSPSGLR